MGADHFFQHYMPFFSVHEFLSNATSLQDFFSLKISLRDIFSEITHTLPPQMPNVQPLSRLSMIVPVCSTECVVGSDWRFDNLCGSHLLSLSELYYVSWWYKTLVIDLTDQLSNYVPILLVVCQLSRVVIGYEDSKCHWCVSILLLLLFNSLLFLAKLERLSTHSLVVSFAWVRTHSFFVNLTCDRKIDVN